MNLTIDGPIENVLCQTSQVPPSMHRKVCCMQNNRLLTKSHVQLEDNSNTKAIEDQLHWRWQEYAKKSFWTI